jgi:hypothetical protein
MTILFSTEFQINKINMKRTGAFDALLDEDSHFFINLKRLQATKVPEFAKSYERINAFFTEIGLLLNAAKPDDKIYRTAIKKFHFPEVNGINLGFSSGRTGNGFGPLLEAQIIRDAYQIVQTGSAQPEIFHLTSLFEENVGPDRVSDMIARLVAEDIIAYSKRIFSELGITDKTHKGYVFRNEIPGNPYKKNTAIFLLPVEILHELPIARDWSDIDRVMRENEAIRNELNALVSDRWSKMATRDKKQYMLEWVFKNPARLKRIVDSYKRSSVEPFNIYSNIDYLISSLLNELSFPEEPEASSSEAAHHIVERYKEWVEYHRGSEVLADVTSRKGEKTIQKTLYATAMDYCDINNIDISPETDSGRGPVDFKISRGTDKTVIEIKLTSNQDCVHGIVVQIEEYAKAENTENKIFVLVDNGVDSGRVEAVIKKREEMMNEGKHPADLVIIDATLKKSASTYKPKDA